MNQAAQEADSFYDVYVGWNNLSLHTEYLQCEMALDTVKKKTFPKLPLLKWN